jgi:uncharacterized protein
MDARPHERTENLRPAAVITGGSRGIGLSLAHVFATKGYDVLLVARDPARVEAAAAGVAQRTTRRAIPLALDIASPTATSAIAGMLQAHGLYCDVLVNNAAVGLAGPFVSHPSEKVSELVVVNIEALTRLTRNCLPEMLERGRGGVLNIASLGGLVPGPHQAAYYASKAYVVSLTEALASENAGSGVRIAAVVPGPVETDFHRDMAAETSLYRRVIPAMTADAVARSAYRGWSMGRRVIAPGLLGTLGFAALKATPHSLSVPLLRQLLARPNRPVR